MNIEDIDESIVNNFSSEKEEEVGAPKENPREPLSIKKRRFWKWEDNPFIVI